MTRSTRTIRGAVAAITLALVGALIGQGGPAYAAAPPVPTGLQSDAAPLLRWDAMPGAAKYEVEVGGTTTTTVNTAFSPTTTLPSGANTWRVRAVSSGNERSDWAVSSLSTPVVNAPTPTSPASGADLTQPGEPPLLTWTSIPGATSYTVQVDGDEDMVGAASYVTKNTSLVVPTTLGEGDWFWQVTATRGAYSSLPSAVSQFDIVGITRPALVSPVGGAQVTDIVLDWDPVPGAKTYDVQVSTNEDFAATPGEELYQVTGVRGTRYSPATTYNNEDYFWRVRAVDPSGNAPQWGSVSYAEFSKVYLAKPVQTFPADNATVGNPIFLEWQPVDHASEYQIEVSTTSGFTPATTTACRVAGTVYTFGQFAINVNNGVISGNRTEEKCRLSAGRTYWHVRPLDSPFTKSGTTPGVQGLFSETRSFIYNPATITGMSPSGGQTVDIPTLSWDPVLGVENYRVEIHNKFDDMVMATNTKSTTYTLHGQNQLTASDGPYTWSVLAGTSAGEESLVYYASFNVSGTIPTTAAAPLTPLSPSASDTTIRSAPSLRWEPMAGAAYYKVDIGPASDGAQTWFAETNGALFQKAVPYPAMTETTRTLFEPGSYDWRVSAYAADGSFIASGPESRFTVQQLQAVTGHKIAINGTTLRSGGGCGPSDNCIAPATPTLRWTPDPRVAYYIVYMSRDPQFTNLLEPDTGMPATTNSLWAPTLSTKEWAFADSTSSGAYYWHIRPCSDSQHCAPGPVSTTGNVQHSFKKTSPTPTGLTSSDPAGTEISFSWNDYFDDNQAYTWPSTSEKSPQAARQYRIQVSTDASFGNVVDTAVVDQTAYTSATNLYAEGTYFWRVQAIDSNQNSLTWSATKTFTKSTPTVAQTSPSGAVPTGDALTFRWEPQAFATAYDVEAYANNDTTHSTGNRVFPTKRVTTVAYAPDTPLPASATNYLWRVRRVDSAGNVGPWSADRSFTVSTAAPVITSPAPGSDQPATGPVVTWTAVPGAATYAVALTSSGGSTVESATTPSLAYAATKKFGSGSYTASVTAKDADGKNIGTSQVGFTVDAGLAAIQPPVISAPGGSMVGATLTSTDPVWNQADVTNAYQWLRDGNRISGATSKTYTLIVSDMGKAISLQVTGSRPNYDNGVTVSNTLGVTAAGALQATVQPAVSGTTEVGQTLRASAGVWSQSSPTFKYQWLRTGAPIPGATSASYRLTPEDAGRDIAVTVLASKTGYSDGSATSPAVSVSRMRSSIAGSLKSDRVKKSKRAKLGITLTVSGLTTPTGTIQVLDKGKKIGSFTMAPVHKGKKNLKLKKLKPGKHKLKIVYLGNAQVFGSKSKKVVLYIVR